MPARFHAQIPVQTMQFFSDFRNSLIADANPAPELQSNIPRVFNELPNIPRLTLDPGLGPRLALHRQSVSSLFALSDLRRVRRFRFDERKFGGLGFGKRKHIRATGLALTQPEKQPQRQPRRAAM
jgi:hypothetical protein